MLKVINARFAGRFSCVALVLAVAFGGGCGGNTIRRPFLIGMDSSVEWIFQAPTQFGTSMFGGFTLGLGEENIGGTALTEDGQVVVLTNYGTSQWFYQDSNVYLLNLETGRIIRHVRGPAGSGTEWYLDGKMVYVKEAKTFCHNEHGLKVAYKWRSINLDTGEIRSEINNPRGEIHKEFGLNPDRHELPAQSTVKTSDVSRLQETISHALGGNRWLVIKHGERKTPIMELVYTDSEGQRRRRRLGRLRHINESMCHVLVNDRRRLLLSTGRYLICLDMRSVVDQRK